MPQKDENVVSMEKELFVRQVAKKGVISGGDQPTEIATTAEQTSTVSITIHEEAIKPSREKRFEKLREAAVQESPTDQNQSSKPKIQRVPFMLRDHKNFDKYFKPRVVAIGPFHHGEPKYDLIEKVKLKLAASFVKECRDQEDMLNKIEVKIKELRECYDEEATKGYDDEALAWMLFVDGCSVLEFIDKYDELEKFKIKSDQVAFVQQDLFLLENQLPYLVLTLLMSCSNKCEELKRKINEFVDRMDGLAEPAATGCFPWRSKTKKDGEHTINVEDREPTHLLELLRTTMLRGSSTNHEVDIQKEKKGKRGDFHQSFRNVQELQAAGIHFRPSESKSLGNINFKPCLLCCGFLELPRINVDDSTGPKFMNLIAYEMCPDFQNDFGVTSYIGFLDSLIDHPDDVKDLRKKRILHNLLGSDEEVAQLFNEIGTDLVPNNKIYSSVTAEIEKHVQTKWKSWMAQFFHDHFSSPWTILAFIGILAGLGMTGIQTWFTVFSDPSPCDAVCKYLKTHAG